MRSAPRSQRCGLHGRRHCSSTRIRCSGWSDDGSRSSPRKTLGLVATFLGLLGLLHFLEPEFSGRLISEYQVSRHGWMLSSAFCWRGSETDGNEPPLRAGILAASLHNAQPWLFAVSARTIAVYADRARHLGTFDPVRREMHLGWAASARTSCAARAFDIAAEVRPAPGRSPCRPHGRP
jgi:hypothetical protein